MTRTIIESNIGHELVTLTELDNGQYELTNDLGVIATADTYDKAIESYVDWFRDYAEATREQ